MKPSPPSANSLLSALRARLSSFQGRAKVNPARADPRALVGAHDRLTGLPGLISFEGTLQQAARRADAESQHLALLFVNLDDLKSVNTTAGRVAGDYVLRQSAKRLRALIKPFMAARLAGDEFLLLMADDPQAPDASTLAQKIQASIAAPFLLAQGEVSLSCSVGIARYPEHGAMSTLIAHAQAAMGAARTAGGAGYAFFEPRMVLGQRDQLDLLKELRRALGLQ